jgi:integrase
MYRSLLATAVYTGLRQSELLGLVWRDIDFEGGFVRVRRQLDRKRGYVEPKTTQAIREVVLAPSLGRSLREHRLASLHSRDDDPVFANAAGRPFEHRNVQARGFDKFVVVPGRWLRRHEKHPRLQGFVKGATAAAAGAIAGAAIVIGRETITGPMTAGIGLVALAALLQRRVKVPEPAIVAAAAVAGLLLHD